MGSIFWCKNFSRSSLQSRVIPDSGISKVIKWKQKNMIEGEKEKSGGYLQRNGFESRSNKIVISLILILVFIMRRNTITIIIIIIIIIFIIFFDILIKCNKLLISLLLNYFFSPCSSIGFCLYKKSITFFVSFLFA